MSQKPWLRWLLVASLLGAASWHQLAQIHRVLGDARPTRDYAIYEINVSAALHGHQWWGPYSQWFHHPGPAYFYYLAVPYALLQRTTFSLYAGGQILTIVFVLATAAALCRWTASNALIVLFVPMVALELGYLGDFPLFDFWPPYVLFFGYGLFLVLCAGLAARKLAALAPAVALASLLVQTHVSYVPAVGAAAAVAAASAIRMRAVPLPRGTWLHVAVGAAVLIVLWALPLYADLFAGKHNFDRLHRVFFETPPRRWNISAIIDRAALELSGPWQFALFRDRFIVPGAPKHYGPARFIAILQLVALGVAWSRARKRDDTFAEALCLLCLVSFGVAGWSLTKIRGDVAPHHTAWISIIGFVGTLAAAAALHPSPPLDTPTSPLVRMTGIAAAWAMYVFVWPIRIIAGIHTNSEVATLASSVVDVLHREHITRPRITWAGTGDRGRDVAEFDWASAVMLDLEKRQVPFFVSKSADLRWMIGAPRWEGSGEPLTREVRFSVGTDPKSGSTINCVERGDNYFMRYPVCAWLQ